MLNGPTILLLLYASFCGDAISIFSIFLALSDWILYNKRVL